MRKDPQLALIDSLVRGSSPESLKLRGFYSKEPYTNRLNRAIFQKLYKNRAPFQEPLQKWGAPFLKSSNFVGESTYRCHP